MKKKEDIIKYSNTEEKDKVKLKISEFEKNTKVILNLMMEDPFCYPPSYEKHTGDLTGLYCRRINRQHRIVYEVDKENNEIHIIRMWTHYDKL